MDLVAYVCLYERTQIKGSPKCFLSFVICSNFFDLNYIQEDRWEKIQTSSFPKDLFA